MTVRLLIADEKRDARERLRSILEQHPDFEVDCEAASDEEAMRLALERRPDVGLIEVRQDRVDGIRLIPLLETRGCSTRFLVCSDHDRLDLAMEAVDAGAWGYVLKCTPAEETLEAVDAVRTGELYLAHSLATKLAEMAAEHGACFLLPSILSPTEREMLDRTVKGDSFEQIADHLGLPLETIELRRGRLIEKLDRAGVVDLVAGELHDALRQGRDGRE